MSEALGRSICDIPTELGRGNLVPSAGLNLESEFRPGKTYADVNRDGLSLNDLKWLYALPEDQRSGLWPTFEIELGNGKLENVALDEYLMVMLLPQHRIALTYWLGRERFTLKSKYDGEEEDLKIRKYYVNIPSTDREREAVHPVYARDHLYYVATADLEAVMSALYVEIAVIGGIGRGYTSGILKGNVRMRTERGTVAEMSAVFNGMEDDGEGRPVYPNGMDYIGQGQYLSVLEGNKPPHKYLVTDCVYDPEVKLTPTRRPITDERRIRDQLIALQRNRPENRALEKHLLRQMPRGTERSRLRQLYRSLMNE